MSLKQTLIKNTGFNLAGYFYLLLASFFSISILLSHLGRDVFGVYLFLSSFIPLAAVFEFGVSNAVIRKLSLPGLDGGDRVRVWKTSFAFFIATGLALSAIVLCLLLYLTRTMPLFLYLDPNILNWSILLISVIVLVNHVDNHFLNLTQANQRFDIFNTKTLLVGTANTLISAGLSVVFPNVAFLYAAQLLFHLLTLGLMAKYAYQSFPGRDFSPSYDSSTGRELLTFGLKNFVGTLAGQIENQFSNFMLGALVSAKAITSFGIPQSIVAKGAGIISQFAQAFFPLSTSLLERDRIKKLRSLVLGLELFTLSGGLLAIFLSFTFGQVFLLWWLKDAIVVETAFPVLKILSFYFLLVSLTPIPTALLQGLNKPQIPSFFGVLTVAIEIVLSLLLVPTLGAIGMAYSFFFSVCLTVPTILIVTWIQLEREIKRTQSLA